MGTAATRENAPPTPVPDRTVARPTDGQAISRVGSGRRRSDRVGSGRVGSVARSLARSGGGASAPLCLEKLQRHWLAAAQLRRPTNASEASSGGLPGGKRQKTPHFKHFEMF